MGRGKVGGEPRAVHCFATQGSGSADEQRIATLLERLDPAVVPFDRTRKATAFLRLMWHGARHRPDLLVMEGTGVAGGAAVIALRFLRGIPYVVSSGDAVAPYVRASAPALAPAAWLYERLLYRSCAGFIGWSPYMVGRAITLGARRAMTAANWAPKVAGSVDRGAMRRELGIDDNTVVFGIVGSLAWSRHRRYGYGMELVEAVAGVDRPDIRVLVVGDGDGRRRLERRMEGLRERVIFAGAVPRPDVPRYLAAMDVASLPQSVDGLGAVRYTTKLSEYLAAGLPVVTGRLPFAYDLDDGWLWRLPGHAPWDRRYIEALARLMATVTHPEIAARRARVPTKLALFDGDRQQQAVDAFVTELLDDQ